MQINLKNLERQFGSRQKVNVAYTHILRFAASTLKLSLLLLAFMPLFLNSCDPVPAFAEQGIASWYGSGNKREGLNKHTANGEVFNPNDLTCATYSYPFNALLKVTNLSNNKSVIVRVNDRGPNKRLGRVIDLSRASFEKISPLNKGLIIVKVEEL